VCGYLREEADEDAGLDLLFLVFLVWVIATSDKVSAIS
jgi:hypothetical protein